MKADYLDRYSRMRSPIHRLPDGFKLLMVLSLVVFVMALPMQQAAWLSGVGALLIGIVLLSRIPVGFLLLRMLWLEPLVLGIAVLSLFQPGGWRIFLWLLAKCTLCLLTMLILANTTPFSAILRIFRKLRFPALLITTLALMYRYIFVLVDESQRMRRARLSRTFHAGRMHAWRINATVISQLFIRASERAERIYAAMCARGWR